MSHCQLDTLLYISIYMYLCIHLHIYIFLKHTYSIRLARVVLMYEYRRINTNREPPTDGFHFGPYYFYIIVIVLCYTSQFIYLFSLTLALALYHRFKALSLSFLLLFRSIQCAIAEDRNRKERESALRQTLFRFFS